MSVNSIRHANDVAILVNWEYNDLQACLRQTVICVPRRGNEPQVQLSVVRCFNPTPAKVNRIAQDSIESVHTQVRITKFLLFFKDRCRPS